ncbi:MAG: hypothetical protein BDTLLHRC_000519 [Candidatus Fervidibacter sp.]|jgi:hypothetical protein
MGEPFGRNTPLVKRGDGKRCGSVHASIAVMGVTPQIGSFGKPQPKAIAPTNLPLMKMGLPLIPAITPDLRRTTVPPSMRIKMASKSKSARSKTPKTVTGKRSISVPRKTLNP